MKTFNQQMSTAPNSRSRTTRGALSNLMLTALITIAGLSLNAQTETETDTFEFKAPSWWFGGAGAANVNFYRGSTQHMNADLTTPVAFHNGMGIGLFAGPVIEYHKMNTRFGFILMGGYDNRSGVFDQVTTPCDCPADLDARLSYISIEPNLKFAPFKSGFYLFGGPRIALNLKESFTYQLGLNPAYPEQIASPAVKGNFSNGRDTIISMQVGLGYDIPLWSRNHQTQMMLSPFVAFHPYFGQNPRSIETWNITTFRGGAILKFGVGKRNDKDEKEDKIKAEEPIVVAPKEVKPLEDKVNDNEYIVAGAGAKGSKVKFSIDSPENIPSERLVKESFPLANYVFFDLGSTQIPKRYKQLNKTEVVEFREDRVDLYTPADLSGRAVRQMTVYYNVLNILGIRMKRYPDAELRLFGASDEGVEDGKMMAESVKNYLVTAFGVEPSRITTTGRVQPKIPSEQPGGTEELVRLRQEDRRVSIESSSPSMLIEYQTDPNSRLRPVEIQEKNTAPIESYVSFEAEGSKEEFSSWSIEFTDEEGTMRNFGPFTTEIVTMAGAVILGVRKEGTYKVRMIGQPKKKGDVVIHESTLHLVQWQPAETDVAKKYSVMYNYNESNAIEKYDKYIREVVVPAIPQNGTVIIHGHTDDIGDFDNNQRLSTARANDVKSTIQKELAAKGRSDVKFRTFGFGEEAEHARFDNKLPEQRMYNRGVVIEVVPPRQ